MVDNIITKPLGVVLIVTAHMVFNVSSQAEVTGILGTNITLQFTFNVSLTENIHCHFAVYKTGQKIAGYKFGGKRDIFAIYPENNSVFWRITNLKLDDNGTYWVSLFINTATESSRVQLTVREEDRSSSTASPEQSFIPTSTEESGSSSLLVIVLVVSPVVLLAAVLPGLIWCLMRSNDKQQQSPSPQNSNPTVQETVEASPNVPAASLVYSVLDFPKRPPAVLEVNLSDTEYAAVSYLPKSRRVYS